jgi:hypothetical protein
MTTSTPKTAGTLVADPDVQTEFGGISAMTLHRWTIDPELGFPPPIKIRNLNFRSRDALEKFKADLIRKAIADRKTTLTAA